MTADGSILQHPRFCENFPGVAFLVDGWPLDYPSQFTAAEPMSRVCSLVALFVVTAAVGVCGLEGPDVFEGSLPLLPLPNPLDVLI